MVWKLVLVRDHPPHGLCTGLLELSHDMEAGFLKSSMHEMTF